MMQCSNGIQCRRPVRAVLNTKLSCLKWPPNKNKILFWAFGKWSPHNLANTQGFVNSFNSLYLSTMKILVRLWFPIWRIYISIKILSDIYMNGEKPVDVDNKKSRLSLSRICFSPILLPVSLTFPAAKILVCTTTFLVAQVVKYGLCRRGFFCYICYQCLIQVPRDTLKPKP